MNNLLVLIFLVVFSGGGIIYLVVSRLKTVRIMNERDLIIKIQESRCLFTDFYEGVVNPAINFWRNSILPAVYKEFEKIISRFRINVLKVEGWLLKLTNYIRGKRKVQNNGNQSQYWKDINDFKNGLNGK